MLTKPEKENIIQMRRKGMYVHEIAAKIGKNKSAVSKVVKEAGLDKVARGKKGNLSENMEAIGRIAREGWERGLSYGKYIAVMERELPHD